MGADNPDLNIKLRAISVLLDRNDISRIDVAEKMFLQTPRGIDDNLLRGLAFSLRGVKDPDAFPILARIFNSQYLEARHSSVLAIREMKLQGAIKLLSKALYDNDQEIRYHGVMGLAMITREFSKAIAVDRYTASEQFYLSYWKDWARKH